MRWLTLSLLCLGMSCDDMPRVAFRYETLYAITDNCNYLISDEYVDAIFETDGSIGFSHPESLSLIFECESFYVNSYCVDSMVFTSCDQLYVLK